MSIFSHILEAFAEEKRAEHSLAKAMNGVFAYLIKEEVHIIFFSWDILHPHNFLQDNNTAVIDRSTNTEKHQTKNQLGDLSISNYKVIYLGFFVAVFVVLPFLVAVILRSSPGKFHLTECWFSSRMRLFIQRSHKMMLWYHRFIICAINTFEKIMLGLKYDVYMHSRYCFVL